MLTLLFYAFFPQHCLYFLPNPHVQEIQVFIVFMLFTELLIFQGFVAQVIKILMTFIVLSLLCLFCNLQTKWKHCVHSLTIYSITQFTAPLYIIVLIIARRLHTELCDLEFFLRFVFYNFINYIYILFLHLVINFCRIFS